MEKIEGRLVFGANCDMDWRDRIGSALRWLASLIDGRTSIALTISAKPELPPAAVEECATRALDDMHRYLKETLRAEVLEIGLKTFSPDLYD